MKRARASMTEEIDLKKKDAKKALNLVARAASASEARNAKRETTLPSGKVVPKKPAAVGKTAPAQPVTPKPPSVPKPKMVSKAQKPYGHTAYTRQTKSGKMVQVQARGVKPQEEQKAKPKKVTSTSMPSVDQITTWVNDAFQQRPIKDALMKIWRVAEVNPDTAYREKLKTRVQQTVQSIPKAMNEGNLDVDAIAEAAGTEGFGEHDNKDLKALVKLVVNRVKRQGNFTGKPQKPKKLTTRTLNMLQAAKDYGVVPGGSFSHSKNDVYKLVDEGYLAVGAHNIYRLTEAGEKALETGMSIVKSLEDAALSRLENRLFKADNNVDVDMDAGHMGIEGSGGQLAMRVAHNTKCGGCLHYAIDHTACAIGLLPSVCGDGSHPEVGYSPAQPNRIASKNWTMRNQDAVVAPSQVPNLGDERGEVPYRIDVLGDSALALSEKMTLVKAQVSDPDAIAAHVWHHVAGPEARKKWEKRGCGGEKPKEGKGRPPAAFIAHIKAKMDKSPKRAAKALTLVTGVHVLPPYEGDFRKGTMSLQEFADAMGTTDQTVRSIARRLGDKAQFTSFIKSKLPDIQVAHGLTDQDMEELYLSAVHTIHNLSPTSWQAWKGESFEGGVTDETLSEAIARGGLLDGNAMIRGDIIRSAPPPQHMPDPEPITQPVETGPANLGFVGGNLALATELHRR